MANVSACDLWTQGGLGQIGLAFWADEGMDWKVIYIQEVRVGRSRRMRSGLGRTWCGGEDGTSYEGNGRGDDQGEER
jgi:hypothetical protein